MDEQSANVERNTPFWKPAFPVLLSLVSVVVLGIAFVLLYNNVSEVFSPDADLLQAGGEDPLADSANVFSPWVLAFAVVSFLLAIWASALSILRMIRGPSSFWNAFGLVTGGGLTLAFVLMIGGSWFAYSHMKDTIAEFKDMEEQGDKLGQLGQELCAQLTLADLATRQESHQRTHGKYATDVDALDWQQVPGMCDHFQFGTDGRSVYAVAKPGSTPPHACVRVDLASGDQSYEGCPKAIQ